MSMFSRNHKPLSRRAVLCGPLALPFVAAKATATMAEDSDTELLALTNEYDQLEAKLHQVLKALDNAQGVAFRNYPKRPPRFADTSMLTAHKAACDSIELSCGVTALEDQESAIADQQSAVLEAIYVTPVRTPHGVLRKLLLADEYGDFRLEAEDDTNSFAAPRLVAGAIRDLERTIGGAS